MSGVSEDESEGLQWKIEFNFFESMRALRGFEDDSVTRFVRKLDWLLKLEI